MLFEAGFCGIAVSEVYVVPHINVLV